LRGDPLRIAIAVIEKTEEMWQERMDRFTDMQAVKFNHAIVTAFGG
jgi:hypothetical protein